MHNCVWDYSTTEAFTLGGTGDHIPVSSSLLQHATALALPSSHHPFTLHPPWPFSLPSLCLSPVTLHSLWSSPRSPLQERQWEPSWTRQVATSAVELSQTHKASS